MNDLLGEESTADDNLDLAGVDMRIRIKELLGRIATSTPSLEAAELAKRTTTELGVEDEDLVNFTLVEAMNVISRRRYVRVPADERVLLIPHCLRDPERCKAPIDDEGYHCLKCGACIIAEITRSAEEKGIKWYMVGGGSHAIRIIKNARPKAILGIACFDEAMMALAKTGEYGIPTQAVLLRKDGCINTEVDLDDVLASFNLDNVIAVSTSSPQTYGTTRYVATVNSARRYLRNRDFLTYASQLVPEPVGSETWSLAWGYMRRFDDMLDSPTLSKKAALNLLEQERSVVEPGFAGDLEVSSNAPIRHRWLAQFFDNERKHYSGEALHVVKDLYESAWGDAERKGIMLSQREMDKLTYKKARCFFKLYFILGDFDLGGHLDDFSYLLGMGLGMLDDMLDVAQDYKAGYVNITREEMEALGVDLEPGDQDFVKQIIDAGYMTLKSKKILSFMLKARELTRCIRTPLVSNFLLRLTEIFAAPILEERMVPGQRYFFKGGRIADFILPENESVAYKVGHKFIKFFLMYPQVISPFFQRPSSF